VISRTIDLYLAAHNKLKRLPCCLAVSEPAIPASELPQFHALDLAAIATSYYSIFI
jgi:hypothetical protein